MSSRSSRRLKLLVGLRRVHPLSCQLGPKDAVLGSRIRPRDGLNPKSPGVLVIPQTTSFRPCSRAARAGDNSEGEPFYDPQTANMLPPSPDAW